MEYLLSRATVGSDYKSAKLRLKFAANQLREEHNSSENNTCIYECLARCYLHRQNEKCLVWFENAAAQVADKRRVDPINMYLARAKVAILSDELSLEQLKAS